MFDAEQVLRCWPKPRKNEVEAKNLSSPFSLHSLSSPSTEKMTMPFSTSHRGRTGKQRSRVEKSFNSSFSLHENRFFSFHISFQNPFLILRGWAFFTVDLGYLLYKYRRFEIVSDIFYLGFSTILSTFHQIDSNFPFFSFQILHHLIQKSKGDRIMLWTACDIVACDIRQQSHTEFSNVWTHRHQDIKK